MKKALILSLMISLIVLALVSCGGNEGNGGEQTHTHSFGEWETVEPATCVDKGEKVRYCDCGEMQTGVISATGDHNEVVDKAVAPTCTEAGLTEGKHCAFCNLIIIAQTPVDATGHTEVVDVAVPATCTETGLTEGKHCSVCKEVLVKQGVDPIVAHTYDDKYDESCNICGGTRDAECAHNTTEPITGYAATCTEPGLTDGQKCKKCGEVLIYQTSIDAKGHTEVIDEAIAATCTESGLTQGKHCSACSAVLIKQTTIPTLPHTYGEWVVTKNANCGQDGEMARYCTCGAKQTEVIYGAGMHTEITDFSVEPTCATTGLTEGKHCSYCGTILVQQTVIPTLEHSYNAEYSFNYDYHWHTCKNCGVEKDKVEHKFSKEFICTVCNFAHPTEGIVYTVSDYGTYAMVTGYKGSSKKIIIADTYQGLPVKIIYDGAFKSNKTITSVIIPDSVTSIGEMAFYGCNSLTEVAIPDSVISIGEMAFYDCNSLTEVAIPDSVISIDNCAFENCDSLAEVIIGNGVTSVGNYCFAYCSGLTSVILGNNLTSIGYSAFLNCIRLTSIEIPDSVISIGDSAFETCSSLTSIIIGNSVDSIGYNVFNGCKSLISIVIPDSVISIGNYAFRDCSSLTFVALGKNVTSIGNCAFHRCSILKSIVISNNVTSIDDGAFIYCYVNDVYYTGSEEEWKSITIGDSNTNLTTANIHYNYVPEE